MLKKQLVFLLLAAGLALMGTACSSSGENEPGAGQGDQDSVEQEQEGGAPPACKTDLAVGQKQEWIKNLTKGSEGLSFDGKGNLFITSSSGGKTYRAGPDGQYAEWADTPRSLGSAFDKAGNLVIAGAGNKFDSTTKDGKLYRIAPDGTVQTFAEGVMKNPNFVTRTPWGTWLVSDDAVPEIWEVTDDGAAALWSDRVPSPNGMVFSADGARLFVASTFESNSPVYALTVTDRKAVSAEAVVHLSDNAWNDGIAMDEAGNLLVAANGLGKIVRIAPDRKMETVAEDLTTPASLAFGEGEGFDPCSIYVTELYGTSVWRISLGVHGQPWFK